MTFFHADPATDLTPIKNITFSNDSRSKTSSAPPTKGINTDKDFGAGSESDPFTDKMVSGTITALTRQIAAALRKYLSVAYQRVLKMHLIF